SAQCALPAVATHAREIRVQSPQLSFCPATKKARPQANCFAAALHLGLFCPLGVVIHSPGRKQSSMSKEIYISSTPHETRLAIVEKDELTEIYYERENEYTLAGSIYNGRVTRVLPGMQSSFVDIGLERDAFLYITDFMEEAGDSADFEAADGSRGRADRNKSNGRGRSDENG